MLMLPVLLRFSAGAPFTLNSSSEKGVHDLCTIFGSVFCYFVATHLCFIWIRYSLYSHTFQDLDLAVH